MPIACCWYCVYCNNTNGFTAYALRLLRIYQEVAFFLQCPKSVHFTSPFQRFRTGFWLYMETWWYNNFMCWLLYNHIGIVINNKLTVSDRILSACRKGQKAYYALNDVGSNYFNPLTLSHLYKTIVLPTVLYWCELWNNISANDYQRLNVFQKCTKSIDQNKIRYFWYCFQRSTYNIGKRYTQIVISRRTLYRGSLVSFKEDLLNRIIFFPGENFLPINSKDSFRMSSMYWPLTILLNNYKRSSMNAHFYLNRLWKR